MIERELGNDGSFKASRGSSERSSVSSEIISFHAEVPIAIQEAMNGFIDEHPNWDQYRLLQAAIAGFLVQNGSESRQLTRLYISNMFASTSLVQRH